jgi:hypothetical protein
MRYYFSLPAIIANHMCGTRLRIEDIVRGFEESSGGIERSSKTRKFWLSAPFLIIPLPMIASIDQLRLTLLALCALFKPSSLTPVSRCCHPCLIRYLNGSNSKIPAASPLATHCRALMGRRSTWGESAGLLDSLVACLNPSWPLSTIIAN